MTLTKIYLMKCYGQSNLHMHLDDKFPKDVTNNDLILVGVRSGNKPSAELMMLYGAIWQVLE